MEQSVKEVKNESNYGREPTPEELEGYYKPLRLEYTYLTLSQLFKNYSSDNDLLDNLNEIRLPD